MRWVSDDTGGWCGFERWRGVCTRCAWSILCGNGCLGCAATLHERNQEESPFSSAVTCFLITSTLSIIVLGPQPWLLNCGSQFSVWLAVSEDTFGHHIVGRGAAGSSEWRQSSTSRGPSPKRVSSTSAGSWETRDVHLTVSFSYIKLLSDFSVRVKTRSLGPPWPASCFNTLMLLPFCSSISHSSHAEVLLRFSDGPWGWVSAPASAPELLLPSLFYSLPE